MRSKEPCWNLEKIENPKKIFVDTMPPFGPLEWDYFFQGEPLRVGFLPVE